MTDLPVLFLVHGAGHGPWCWQQLISHLADVDVRTIALPSSGDDPARLGDLYDDAAAVAQALASTEGPAVVVGHAYGGSPVTEAAGTVENVIRVVYLTAMVQDAGDSVVSITAGALPHYWKVHRQSQGSLAGDYFEVSQPLDILYDDVEPQLAQRAVNRLGPQSLASVTQPLTQAAWRTVPSTYITCSKDKAIPLPLQEAMAHNAHRIRRMNSSHSPFLSQPAELARILRDELTA